MEEKERYKVYIETSIPSYLTARRSNDLVIMANQNITLEWWESCSRRFQLFISELVLAEASEGDKDAAIRRLKVLENIPELKVTEVTRSLAQTFLESGTIPAQAQIDAYHIAVAAINGMDYLLTWNCTHIANAIIRPRIEHICRNQGYEPPVICTPLELMEE